MLSPGKARSLQTASTPDGIFKILAIDHRDSLRVIINPDNPASVPSSTLTELKLTIIEHIAPYATAIMLDPLYSAAQAIVSGALPGNVGFLSALEAQGYSGTPHARQTTLLDNWSVEKAKRLGASGIKLLVYYHPDAGEAAEQQETVIKGVIADCARHEIALFLEPLFYSIDQSVPVNSAEFAMQRRRIVVETVHRLGSLAPDVLKIQFPIDASHEAGKSVWKAACEELNDASPVPWALLSGGDPYDIFKQQLKIACQAGCSGFMAGRALWQEVISASASDRPDILKGTVLSRFQELSQIVETYGHSWREKHKCQIIDENWFVTY